MEPAENIRPLTTSIIQKFNDGRITTPLLTLLAPVARVEIKGALWWYTKKGNDHTKWELHIVLCEQKGLRSLRLIIAIDDWKGKHALETEITSSFVRWTGVESVEETYSFNPETERGDAVPTSIPRAVNLKMRSGQKVTLIPSEKHELIAVKMVAAPGDLTPTAFVSMVSEAIALA